MEFEKLLKIAEYKGTKEILEAVNQALLAGAKPTTIVTILEEIANFKRLG
jgi:hypothetical protein